MKRKKLQNITKLYFKFCVYNIDSYILSYMALIATSNDFR